MAQGVIGNGLAPVIADEKCSVSIVMLGPPKDWDGAGFADSGVEQLVRDSVVGAPCEAETADDSRQVYTRLGICGAWGGCEANRLGVDI